MKIYQKKIAVTLLLVIAGISLGGRFIHAQTPAGGATRVPAGSTVSNNPPATAQANSNSTTGAPAPNTQTNNSAPWGLSPSSWVNTVLANIVNGALSVAGYFVSIAASLLNVSIIITLHIKDFVAATPAIYSVWQTIRDITGIFFIFVLLIAAFQMIFGVNGGLGKTIKNIVIAGILINFSFFLVSVAIDFSNITSQAIYNAMIPSNGSVAIGKNDKLADLTTRLSQNSPGIAGIFTNSLKIQSFYDAGGNKVGPAVGNPFTIMLIGAVGIVIMITAALSFLLAAAAFIIRLIILLFILAFSPVLVASLVIPQLKDRSKHIWDQMKSQLIFMPVYLLLMYAALSILNNSNLMGAANASLPGVGGGANWAFNYTVLAVNFVMVIFMLNLPLLVGLKMGGYTSEILGKLTDKFDARKIWRNIGGRVDSLSRQGASGAWQNTGGRAASAIIRSEGFKDWASKKGVVGAVGRVALKGTRGIATDYSKRLKDQVDKRTEFAESLGFDEREVSRMEADLRQQKQTQATLKAAGNTAASSALDAPIRALESDIINKKKERQASYASDLNTKGVISGAQTLWTKVARKDKVAAAKINVGVWQKQLEAKKKDLDEKKADLKQVETEIRRNDGVANTKQQEALDRLRPKILAMTSNLAHGGNIADMGVNDLQNLIDQTKLIK